MAVLLILDKVDLKLVALGFEVILVGELVADDVVCLLPEWLVGLDVLFLDRFEVVIEALDEWERLLEQVDFGFEEVDVELLGDDISVEPVLDVSGI